MHVGLRSAKRWHSLLSSRLRRKCLPLPKYYRQPSQGVLPRSIGIGVCGETICTKSDSGGSDTADNSGDVSRDWALAGAAIEPGHLVDQEVRILVTCSLSVSLDSVAIGLSLIQVAHPAGSEVEGTYPGFCMDFLTN